MCIQNGSRQILTEKACVQSQRSPAAHVGFSAHEMSQGKVHPEYLFLNPP
jgi:hypothetical protein